LCRLRSRHVPSTVYEMRKSRPISILTRARVHRWSAQPCASGLRSNSRSSRATWVPLSLGRPGAPFEATPSAPPPRHCRRHRSTDLSDTRRVAATTVFLSPASNRATAVQPHSLRWGRPLRRRLGRCDPPVSVCLPG
jgi:hypothetical protein